MKRKHTELLIEQVVSAHRPADPLGTLRFHPAWHDLDEAGRREAYDRTLAARRLEASADPQGLSTTAHAILQKLNR